MSIHSISEKYGRSISRMAALLLALSGLIGMGVISLSLLAAADARLDRSQEIAQVALPYSVWNYDEAAIAEFLDAMSQDPELDYVMVEMEGITIARPESREKTAKEHFRGALFERRSFAIVYEGRDLALMTMVQSRTGLWTKIAASFVALALLILLLLQLIIRRSMRLTERYIFTPLKRLEASAALMAEGNLEQGLNTEGDDEIASLARSLDSMRGAIANLFDRLQQANAELSSQNQILEEKVQERTQELERLNQRLNLENLRMGAELEVTKRLQEMVLPRDEELCAIEGLEISTHMEPADEVGGDYFDVLSHGDRVRIGIGDVTGHGLESGVLMLLTQSAVRTLSASEETDISRMVETLNRSLMGNINRMGSGKNLTFALIDYKHETGPEGSTGQLTVVGQHESVLICRNDGSIEEVDTLMLGMPIGLVDEVGEYLGEEQITLHPGDVVVLFTDGITEAADVEHRLFGMDQLKQTLARNHQRPAVEIKQGIIEAVKAHMGERELLDDLTLLVLKQVE